MAFSSSFNKKNIIDDIKLSTDIVDIIGRYVELKKKGINYFGLCPFHDDHDPSMSVSPKKQMYKCFVCGAGGDVFNFVAKKENISYIQAVIKVGEMINYDQNKLNELKNFNSKYQDHWTDEQLRAVLALKRVQTFFSDFLFNPKYPNGLNYLKSRGLSEELIKQFDLGLAINEKNQIKMMLTNENHYFPHLVDQDLKFNAKELRDAGLISEETLEFNLFNRITFPIKNQNGTIIAYSGRSLDPNLEPKYLLTPSSEIFNKSEVLYNLHSFFQNDEVKYVYLTEGFMDTIACVQAGFKTTVATMGTSLGEEQIRLLKQLKKLKRVVLALDNDQAGLNANLNIGLKLLESGFNVSIIDYQNIDAKDADEIVQKFGINKLQELFTQQRVDFLSFYVNYHLNQNLARDEIQDVVQNLLKTIANYGNDLNSFDLLKQISEKSQISFESIQTSFNHLKQELVLSHQSFNELNKTSKHFYKQQSFKKQDVDYDPKPELEDLKQLQEALNQNFVSQKFFINPKKNFNDYVKQIDKWRLMCVKHLNILLADLFRFPQYWKNEFIKQINLALSNLINVDKNESYRLLMKYIEVYLSEFKLLDNNNFVSLLNEKINEAIVESQKDEKEINKQQNLKDLIFKIQNVGQNFHNQYPNIISQKKVQENIKNNLNILMAGAYDYKLLYLHALKLKAKIDNKKEN